MTELKLDGASYQIRKVVMKVEGLKEGAQFIQVLSEKVLQRNARGPTQLKKSFTNSMGVQQSQTMRLP